MPKILYDIALPSSEGRGSLNPAAPQPTVDMTKETLLECPVCKQKMVVYDKATQRYMCLNNKECSFLNNILEVPAIPVPNSSVQVTNLNPIKSLSDLKGKIIKEFRIEENEDHYREEIIIKFEGQDKELRLIPYEPSENTEGIIRIEAKLIGKKQIITYEDVEEELDN